MTSLLLSRLTVFLLLLLIWMPELSMSQDKSLSPSSRSALLNAAKRIDRLRDEVIADLKSQLTKVTKEGRLDEALALREEIERLSLRLTYRLPMSDSWSSGAVWNPLGGRVKSTTKTVSLLGPGTGDTQNAVAVFREPLSVGETVRGSVTVNNDWCGFALGASHGGRDFYSFYTHGDKSFLWKHSGKNRKEVAVDIPVKIPVGKTAPFSIFRPAKDRIILSVGDSSYTFIDESDAGYWGITTYDGGEIEINFD